jgi:hypothetical protein
MYKRILLLISIALVISHEANAQSYKFSLGLRGGLANGLTGKYFVADTKAIEGIFSVRYRGFAVTGLYEIHKSLKEENFSFFYGIGAHVASYRSYYYYGFDRRNVYTYKNHIYYEPFDETISVLGVDAILGLEYRFKAIPFTLGLDVKPFFDLVTGGSSNFLDIAGSIRYIIK